VKKTSVGNPFGNWDNPYVTVRFHCRICEKELPNKNYWKTHYGLHKNSFKCETCGRSFGTSSNLKRHEKGHLKTADDTKPTIGTSLVKQEHDHQTIEHSNSRPIRGLKLEGHFEAPTTDFSHFIKQEHLSSNMHQQHR